MLKSYIKIAVAVLLRRKFMTFVNLFGASLTLLTLVVAVAVLDSFVSPVGAQHRQEHILVVREVLFTRSAGGYIRIANLGLPFYERYIRALDTPDRTSYASELKLATSYVDGRKLTPAIRRTDAAYWDILDFTVLDGRTISTDDVEQGRFVAVMNEATAHAFFPEGPAVGERITVDSESYEVIGIVANEPETSRLAYADVWVPFTAGLTAAARDTWFGDGIAMLYVEDPAMRGRVREEYRHLLEGFEYTPNPDQIDTAVSAAESAFDMVANDVIGRTPTSPQSWAASRAGSFIVAAFAVALLFMVLPAINMANVNLARILERAPEIGLRKAAGAPKRTLVGQLVFENIVLAASGGVAAFAAAPLLLGFLNATLFTYGDLRMDASVFLVGLGLIVVFGVLSGAYPAFRMAALEPAAALRGGGHA